MRELDQVSEPSTVRALVSSVAIVGAGRLGRTVAAGLARAGVRVDGPLPRGADGHGSDAVLLCVPDDAIAAAAACVAAGPAGPLVGHCSGATGLDVLGPREAFSLHPLTAVADRRRPAPELLVGAGAAIDGTTPRARQTARALAEALGLRPVRIDPADRAAYHAAASIAANFVVTLEAAAERLAATAGVDRTLLAPLVRAAVENWVALGPRRALTGPVARGDERTVARQRQAVAQRAPELTELFDALVRATRALAPDEDAAVAR